MAKQHEEMEDDVFNLKETEASSYLTQKKQTDDGLLRPKVEEGKDGVRELVIRFLPNLMKNGKIGATAVEKHIHYADFPENPELKGYFDCLKNESIGKDCPLCNTFWALKNTKNPKDEEKAKKISRNTKYYAYVLVVEDEQKPENEGKIFIFPYGFKIFKKIKDAATRKRNPCDVEDLITGANMVLKIEEIAGFANYDGSYFEEATPIAIGGKKLKVDDEGKISATDKSRVIEFLKSRSHELDEFKAKDWSPEQREKAEKVISVLTGQSFESSASDVTYKKVDKKPISSANIFQADEDEDEDEAPVKKPTKAAKPILEDEDDEDEAPKKPTKAAKPVVEDDDEDEAPAKPKKDVEAEKSSKKAKMFFGDDEDEA